MLPAEASARFRAISAELTSRALPASQRLIRATTKLLLGTSLPRYDGEFVVSGCREPVRIRRDRYAVPYIDATHAEDGWFGLGFCHGQDRAGQLEIVVRGVRGTLAAVLGKDGLAIDRLSRRIGFRRAGERQLQSAPTSVIAQTRAYTRGLNAGLTSTTGKPSVEHVLLQREPTRWQPADVQGYCALLCFMLASNWDIELYRLKVLELDGPEALRALDPNYPAELSTIARDQLPGSASDHLAADLAAFAELFPCGGASNAWVLGGARTASGRPILANDPHLGANHPGLWYLASVRAGELDVAGASVVGFPALAPGHNGFAAWGCTAAHADNTDLFLEEIDGERVRQGDRFVPCEVREERIEVRGGEAVIERVLVTPRGPVISPPLESAPRYGRGNALSLAATWLSDRAYEGLFRVHEADSFESFRDKFRDRSTSTICATYGDVTGRYGWMLCVDLPQRKLGQGALPMPGWDERCGWQPEPVPFDALPFESDGGDGFYACANNKPAADGGTHLGLDWLDGYRHAAITEALEARRDWTVESTAALQLDTRSLPWRRIREVVLATPIATDGARRAQTLLSAWHGRLSADSPAATIYALLIASLCCRVVREKAPLAAAWALGQGFFTPLLPHSLLVTRRLSHLVGLIVEQPEGYFASWPAEIAAALDGAVRELERRFGPDSNDWAWGRARKLVLHHAFAQAPVLQPLLERLFNIGPLPGAGDAGTIAQGAIDFADPLSGQITVASLRSVMDVGDWDRCRFALCGGQSGNPLSPHYDDQLAAWADASGIPMVWSEARIAERTAHTARLLPVC